MQNDFLLIRKMKQGDDDALDLFVHKYYQDILNYCHYHCSDKTYEEDVPQEKLAGRVQQLKDGQFIKYAGIITGIKKKYTSTIHFSRNCRK